MRKFKEFGSTLFSGQLYIVFFFDNFREVLRTIEQQTK